LSVTAAAVAAAGAAAAGATSHESNSRLLSTKRSVDHGHNSQKIKSESDESAIYFSTLRNALVCPICSLSLLDAVVTPCSHGFCMSCLEQYWSTHVNTTAAACPVCAGEHSQRSDDHQRKQNGNVSSSMVASSSSSSRNDGSTRRYVRSVHLDEVVSVLIAASSTMEQKQFAEREKFAHGVLQALGISMYQHHDHPVESGNINRESEQRSVVATSQVEETDDDGEENDGDEKDNSSSDSYEDHCTNSRQSYDN
jgi:hypothetical protein